MGGTSYTWECMLCRRFLGGGNLFYGVVKMSYAPELMLKEIWQAKINFCGRPIEK